MPKTHITLLYEQLKNSEIIYQKDIEQARRAFLERNRKAWADCFNITERPKADKPRQPV